MAEADASLTKAPAALPAQAFEAPRFRQRFPWIGGDLQTLRNFLLRRRQDLSDWPEQRLELALGDDSGDRLSAALHLPAQGNGGRPLAVLIHGLTGCEDSRHVRATAAALLRHGYPVLRLNLRGAGPSRPLCRGHYHAGRSEDLADALAALLATPAAPTGGGIALIGYSLGANVLLKFLSEADPALPLVGGVSISAPIDLKAAQQRIMRPRNRLYQRYLLRRMVADALAVPGGPSDKVRDALGRVTSVLTFDDLVVAPANGFRSAEDYYRRCSAQHFLAAVRFPTLVIHSRDDPWIPAGAYDALDWPCNPNLLPLLSERGGHVGFHGRWDAMPWHDRCALAFLKWLHSGTAW